jgi:hypothetical protein
MEKTVLDKDTLAIYQSIVDNPKVPMTLRIGIAGPRHVPLNQLEIASTKIGEIFADVSAKLKSYSEDNDIAKQLYDTQGHSSPILRLTSSLAIGVDRLIFSPDIFNPIESLAEYELAGILPFLLEDCEQGFFDNKRGDENSDDWQDLNKCVEQIKHQDKLRLIELDGDISSPNSRDKAHYRCTEYLVENIDLLVVVTHENNIPTPSYNRAGTDTTIRLAKEAGKPVIQIAFTAESTIPEVHIHQAKKFGRNEKPETYSEENLERLLCRLVLFGSLFKLDEALSNQSDVQKSTEKEKSDQQDLIAKGLRGHIDDKKVLKTNDCTTDFDYQGVTSSPFTKFETFIGYEEFGRFKQFFINKREVENKIKEEKARLKFEGDAQSPEAEKSEKSHQPENKQEAHNWFAYFLRADSLAVRFASIHRSTYLLIYFFACSALIIAAMALTFQDHKPLVGFLIVLEFVALTSIGFLYSKDHHNHHKWLQNRCLAEAIRPNVYLSQLGRCFSFFNIRSSDEFMYREIIGHNQSGAQWVCIQAELINRHIGFGHCRYTPEYLAQSIAFIKSAWVSGQVTYHLGNAIRMQGLGKRFSKVTIWLFGLTCAALIIKAVFFVFKVNYWIDLDSCLPLMILYKGSSLFTAVFPILGTAMFAIRNHSEFDISAQRSLTMLAFFNSLKSSITSKEGENSEGLDTELNRLTEVSAQEVSDWLEIYEVKESEPG